MWRLVRGIGRSVYDKDRSALRGVLDGMRMKPQTSDAHFIAAAPPEVAHAAVRAGRAWLMAGFAVSVWMISAGLLGLMPFYGFITCFALLAICAAKTYQYAFIVRECFRAEGRPISYGEAIALLV